MRSCSKHAQNSDATSAFRQNPPGSMAWQNLERFCSVPKELLLPRPQKSMSVQRPVVVTKACCCWCYWWWRWRWRSSVVMSHWRWIVLFCQDAIPTYACVIALWANTLSALPAWSDVLVVGLALTFAAGDLFLWRIIDLFNFFFK